MASDQEELKRRLGNAIPAPSPVATEQPVPPAPIGEPPPAAEVAPAPQPDPNPELLAKIEESDGVIKKLQDDAQRRDVEAAGLRKALEEQAKIPSANELDNLSQGEAIHKALTAMKAGVDAKFQGFADDLNRNVVQPLQKTVSTTSLQQKREVAKSAYPQVSMDQYGKAFDEKAELYPNLTPVEVLKMVANPRDLSGSQEPRTPAPPQGAAHMEIGRSAHAVQPAATGTSTGSVTTTDLLRAAAEAEAKGDRQRGKELRVQATQLRLVTQGVLSPGG